MLSTGTRKEITGIMTLIVAQLAIWNVYPRAEVAAYTIRYEGGHSCDCGDVRFYGERTAPGMESFRNIPCDIFGPRAARLFTHHSLISHCCHGSAVGHLHRTWWTKSSHSTAPPLQFIFECYSPIILNYTNLVLLAEYPRIGEIADLRFNCDVHINGDQRLGNNVLEQ